MAGDQKLGGAYFEISGRAGGAVQAVNQANSAFAQLEQAVATNWWGLQNLGIAFAALPAAVAGAVGVAAKFATEWENSMFDVQRTSGETGEALKAIEDGLFAAARITPIATAELAAMAAEGAALGIANENLAEFAQIMGVLIASTDLTSSNLADVSRVLNIMNVPVAQYENFASALIDVGRNTAATETEITNFARRIAGVASVANLSADEVLGLSAAVLSLGPRAESGATAVTRTLTQIAQALAEGGDEARLFAEVSGQSLEEFTQTFRQSGAQAMADFLTGLGRVEGGLEGMIQVMERLGVDGQRQIQALAALAQGTKNVGDEQTDLNAILALGSRSFQENTSLAEIEAARLNTVTGQLQLLRNMIFEVGASFGNFLLPPMKATIGVLGDFIRGIQTLPGPAKIIVGVMVTLVAAISALLAGLALIGPRIVIAVGILRQLTGVSSGAAGATAQLTGAQTMLGAALSRSTSAIAASTGVTRAHIGAINQNLSATYQNAGATNTLTSSQYQNVRSTNLLRAVYQQFSGSLLMAARSAGVLIAAMAALTYWTVRQGDAVEKQAKKRRQANDKTRRDLTELFTLQQQGFSSEAEARNKSTDAYIRQTDQWKELSKAAKRYGADVNTLNDIIQNKGDQAANVGLVNSLKDAEEQGDKTATVILDNLGSLNKAFNDASSSVVRTTDTMEDFTGATQQASQATDNLRDRLQGIAQAHIDYIGAVFAQREAAFTLQDAERALQEARRDAANINETVARAELSIRKARRSHQNAVRDLADAEADLLTARQRGLDALADAEDDLADSRDSYLDGLDRLKDMEEELTKLRSGPTVEELTKATNDLRDAQLGLLGAERKVADAEWYLQYIREQGGSQRDIEDAEFALLKARQDVANQEEELSDAERELADLRDTAARQEEIVRLERDIAGARRDSLSSLRDIRRSEEDLADIRERVASDTYYKDAQDALIDAQIRVADTLVGISDAEQELADIRSGSALRDVERAQLTYERALYGVAEANTEVRKQTALMRGENWDAGDSARTLAQELAAISRSIPDASARARMQQFVDVLSRAPAVPNPKEYEDAFNAALGGMDLTPGLAGALGGIDPDLAAREAGMDAPSWWDSFAPIIGFALAPLIGQALTAAFRAAVTSLGVSTAVLAGAIAVGTAFVGFLIWWFNDPQRREDFFAGLSVIGEWFKELGRNIVDAIPEGMREKWDQFIATVKDLWGRLVNSVKSFLGISSPSTVFMQIGRDIISGLRNGISEGLNALWGFITGIPSTLLGLFTGSFTWLTSAGSNLMRGLYNGLVGEHGLVSGFFTGLRNGITGGFSTAFTWLTSAGDNIVRGLYNGLVSGWNTVTGWAQKAGGGFLSIWNKAFQIASPSRLFHQMGEMLMLGLAEGMDDSMSMIEKQAELVAKAASPDIDNMAAKYGIDYLLGREGLEKFDSSVGSARVPDGSGGTTTNNYGDVVTINAETNADPQAIVNEYVWSKRVRTRG